MNPRRDHEDVSAVLNAAGVVLLTLLIGLEGSGLAQLAAALVVVMALIVAEKLRPGGV